MADINQVITLGIGTPSGIPEFLSFGLQIGDPIAIVPAPDKRTFTVDSAERTFTVDSAERTFTIE